MAATFWAGPTAGMSSGGWWGAVCVGNVTLAFDWSCGFGMPFWAAIRERPMDAWKFIWGESLILRSL